jgi:hypothetical protein
MQVVFFDYCELSTGPICEVLDEDKSALRVYREQSRRDG